uniref:Uncharacterized protein n=1 Tax=Vespula pensylvanica TaxID=30213 RepID=A0A834P6F0_VESPE|nr:hypothetical protein H0235_006234 [Vespula pensylvanica]
MTMFHERQLVWDKWILAFEVASCIRMTDLDIKAMVYNDGCTIGVSIKVRAQRILMGAILRGYELATRSHRFP